MLTGKFATQNLQVRRKNLFWWCKLYSLNTSAFPSKFSVIWSTGQKFHLNHFTYEY